MKNTLFVFTLLALGLCALGSDCGDKRGKPSLEDPRKAAARNAFNEGRRLFLTCDPNNYPKAIAQFDEALKASVDEEYPEALAAWAETLSMWAGFQINEEAYQTALMRAQRAARLDPQLDMAYRAAADLFRHRLNRETGKYETDYALQMIKRALDLNPDSAENWYVAGSIHLMIDPKIAIEHLEKARGLNPNLGKVYFNLGGAYQTIGLQSMQETGGDAKKLEAARPEFEGWFQKAAAAFQAYRELVPGDIAGQYALGVAYQNMSRFEEAEKMYKQTVSQPLTDDPFQNVWRVLAYVALAKFELDRKNQPAARVYLDRAIQLDPKNPEVLEGLIFVCGQLQDAECVNKYKGALEELKAREEELKKPMQAGSTAEPAPQPGATASPPPPAPAPGPGMTGGGTP